MKKVLAYILFYLGDFVSKFMNYWPSERFHPYNLYNFLMSASVRLQGNAKGPWEEVERDR